jgi:cytochrome P450
MHAAALPPAPAPAHVPPDRIVDFDLYQPPGLEFGIQAAWLRLRDSQPHQVIWTPRHGGHWVALDGPLIYRLYGDYEYCSNEVSVVPRPAQKTPLGALNYDPPQHHDFRILLNSGLGSKSVRSAEPMIRRLTIELIERFRTRGQCEFVREFASILPLSIFLSLVDIPASDREMLAGWVQEITHPSGELDHDGAIARFWAYLLPIVQARRANPGRDMISDIASGTVFGRPLTDAEAMGACTHLMIAGLDTVAAFVGFMMKHLAEHPAQRQRLADEPKLIGPAITEFLRRFPMVTGIRLVARDLHVGGVVIPAGDLIALPTILANLSAELYEDPLAVKWERPPGPIATFGNGPHRCPGSPLAKVEVRILLEEWLKRIPDFTLGEGDIGYGGGFVGTIDKLYLRWDPVRTRMVAESDAA